jgi:NHLM bacteriocin system ABC transporter peptidase/ATP-binding protein
MMDTTRTTRPVEQGQHRAAPKPRRPMTAPRVGGGYGAPRRLWLRRRRVKTPTVLQMEAVECGAASLAMILAYFKCHMNLQQLRVLCGVSRDGSKAGHLLKAARGLGLEASGKQMGVEALAAVTAPAIVFWEFNHYVVWEGFAHRLGKPVVYINDPAQGRRILTLDEFSAGFTGIVLTFRPGKGFTPGGRPPGMLQDLPGRLRGTYGAMAVALIASLLLVAVSTVTPAFTRGFIDAILLSDARSTPTLAFLAMMAVTVALTVVLVNMQQTYLLRAEMSTSTLNSARFLRHMLRLPVTFFSQRTPADVAQRLGTNDRVAEVLSRNITSAFTSALVVCLYGVLLWNYQPTLAMIGISISLLNVALMRVVVHMRQTGVAKLRVDRSKLISTAYSGLQLIETMKATGGERGYFRRWGDHQAALLYQQQRVAAPTAMLSAIGPFLTTLNAVLILGFGGLRAVEGQISIGLLIAFQVLLSNFSRPVSELTSLAPTIQDTVADIARLRDVETTEHDTVFDRPEPDRTKRLGGQVRFEGVTFGYARLAPPLLNEFSFEVGPGQQVSLVGGSGSGKSTVTRLIAGLYQPWAGQILFDGQPHTMVSRSVFAASVAFVDQDIFLFEGSVRDNVTLWDPSISDDAVMAALTDACLDDVVATRPGGIHSQVQQDGRNFSGGQRQRMEIARALVRSPSVLVLDEATSALDAETEQLISENLRRRGCACVVIAHRLSTVRASDEILVLEAGRVVERGTHQELVAAGGAYANLAQEA